MHTHREATKTLQFALRARNKSMLDQALAKAKTEVCIGAALYIRTDMLLLLLGVDIDVDLGLCSI